MYGLADLQAGKLVKCYQYTVPQKCAFLSPSLKDTESQFLTDSDRYLSISGLAKYRKRGQFCHFLLKSKRRQLQGKDP